jgi:hypothetical protein
MQLILALKAPEHIVVHIEARLNPNRTTKHQLLLYMGHMRAVLLREAHLVMVSSSRCLS